MLVSSVALGGLLGLMFRGNWRNLRDFEIRWWPLALFALGIRVVSLMVGMSVGAHVTAILLTTAVATRNRQIPGAFLVAVGTALNAIVILVNGGMPFDAAAAASVGAQTLEKDLLHHPMGPETRLSWLADVVPVGLFRAVYSIGDVIIAAGGFWIPFAALRRR